MRSAGRPARSDGDGDPPPGQRVQPELAHEHRLRNVTAAGTPRRGALLSSVNGSPRQPADRQASGEAGGGGEVVELLGGRVPEVPRPQPDAGLGDVDVLPGDGLRGAVALADRQHHLVGGRCGAG